MLAIRKRSAAFGVGIVLAVAGCVGDRSDAGMVESNSTSPIDRLLIGQASAYNPDRTLRDRLPELIASQAVRRQTAWAVAQKVIEPVGIDEQGQSMPRFQTWYGKEEVVPMFKHILDGQTQAEREAHTPPTPAAIEETFSWIVKRVPTLESFTAAALARRRAELAATGASSLGRIERVLMSPALVGHLLTHYDAMARCLEHVPAGTEPPPSATNFAPCIGEEFPADAAIVKVSWVPDHGPIGVADTSAAALTEKLTSEAWGQPTRTASPGPEAIYTMQLADGSRARLVALHVITKELRDWMWLTMFWSDAPKADFGADRPPAMIGPWAGYKMCAVVDFEESDTGAEDGALDPSLAAAFAATRAFGSRSWCSNPYLEGGPHNAKTNCIGCHQHAGTGSETTAILDAFADGSRSKLRKNFPADYTFVTTGSMHLASDLQAQLGQFLPPQP